MYTFYYVTVILANGLREIVTGRARRGYERKPKFISIPFIMKIDSVFLDKDSVLLHGFKSRLIKIHDSETYTMYYSVTLFHSLTLIKFRESYMQKSNIYIIPYCNL